MVMGKSKKGSIQEKGGKKDKGGKLEDEPESIHLRRPCKYIGSFAINITKTEDRQRMVNERLTELKDVKKGIHVVIIISSEGIKVFDEREQSIKMAHAIIRVAFSTCNPEDRLFTYIAKTSHSTGKMNLQAHVFRTKKSSHAQTLAAIASKAFRIAFAVATIERENKSREFDQQASKEKRKDGSPVENRRRWAKKEIAHGHEYSEHAQRAKREYGLIGKAYSFGGEVYSSPVESRKISYPEPNSADELPSPRKISMPETSSSRFPQVYNYAAPDADQDSVFVRPRGLSEPPNPSYTTDNTIHNSQCSDVLEENTSHDLIQLDNAIQQQEYNSLENLKNNEQLNDGELEYKSDEYQSLITETIQHRDNIQNIPESETREKETKEFANNEEDESDKQSKSRLSSAGSSRSHRGCKRDDTELWSPVKSYVSDDIFGNQVVVDRIAANNTENNITTREVASPENVTTCLESPGTSIPNTECPRVGGSGTSSPRTSSPETCSHRTSSPGSSSPETGSTKTDSPKTDRHKTGSAETDSHKTDRPRARSPDVGPLIKNKESSTSLNGSSVSGSPYQSHRSPQIDMHRLTLTDDDLLKESEWYQSGLSREIAEEVIQADIPGSFLVRDSSSNPGCYVITVRVPYNIKQTGIANYLIIRTAMRMYQISGFQATFSSLASLVAHYASEQIDLPIKLRLASDNPLFKTDEVDGFGSFEDLDSTDPDYFAFDSCDNMMAELQKF